VLSEQDASDHEPRDHEEDVYSDIAPTQTRDMRMKQDDESDRNGSQTLDVRTKSSIPRRRSGFITRR
jgi:hypothetical protein